MDEYRRGRDVTRDDRGAEVSPPFRPILPVVWGVGAVLFVVGLALGPAPSLAVVGVLHVFFAGLVYADITSLRRQGVQWGASRHVWVVATLVVPVAVPAYYVVSGRTLRETNQRRGVAETAT